MTQTCQLCTRPTGDAYACTTCIDHTRQQLRLLADLAHHADDKRARLGSNWRTGTIGRTPDQPLPYDPRVTAVLDSVMRALRPARTLALTLQPSQVPIADHPSAVAIWLVTRLDVLRRHPDGPTHLQHLNAAATSMVRLFDRPPERVYIGQCGHDECIEPLYAEREHTASVVPCPRCHTQHPIDERRTQLAAGVRDYLGTVKEISHLLRETLGEDVSARMIYAYASHGMIATRGERLERTIDGQWRPSALYRIGDVQAAVATLGEGTTQRRAVTRHAKTVAT